MRKTIAIILLAVFVMMPLPSQAQMGKGMGGMPGGGVKRLEYDVKATGLSPVFPDGYVCDVIASPFGSPYRHDGSTRLDSRNSGLHGGLDISLKEGAPLLAVATGKVLAKGEGGMLEGFYLWLQHAPADTGLPYWAYTKYQHLVELPTVNVGDRVAGGQVVALSGLTGTISRVFPSGYPHLHLSLFLAAAPDPISEGTGNLILPPKGSKIADPMLLFLPTSVDFSKIAELPEESKRVAVAVADRNGQIYPAASKVVWPTYCLSKPR